MPPSQVARAASPGGWAAWTAAVPVAGVAYFVAVLVALHLLRPDHDPLRQTTSQYVVGPYGVLMTTALLSLGVASLALLLGLLRGVSAPARSRLGLGLLGVWTVGVLVAMSFPINLDGTPLTPSGRIHRVAGPLAFLGLTAGLIFVSRRLGLDPRWLPVHRAARVLSWIALAGFVAMLLSRVAGLGLVGLAQRVALAASLAWFVLVAGHLGAGVEPTRIDVPDGGRG